MSLDFKRRGFLIVLSAPSGGGKSAILRRLLERQPEILYSTSATTREPRGDELNGRDYLFLSEEEFHRRLENSEFLEFANVHGHWYGTPLKPIQQALESGRDVALDIDVQGGAQLRERPEPSVLIFLAPPSFEVLEDRLRQRKTDSEESIQLRLENARQEMAHWRVYDYLVVNDSLEDAVGEVETIVQAERRRVERMTRADE